MINMPVMKFETTERQIKEVAIMVAHKRAADMARTAAVLYRVLRREGFNGIFNPTDGKTTVNATARLHFFKRLPEDANYTLKLTIRHDEKQAPAAIGLVTKMVEAIEGIGRKGGKAVAQEESVT